MVGRIIVAAILAAGLLSAQRSKGGSSGNMDAPLMRPSQAQSKAEQIAEKLKLSKEQKDQLAAILSSAAESAAPLRQQIAQGRQMIVGAMVNGKDNGDDYNKLITQYTAALAQMDNVEATAYGKIYALLKPNQQKAGEPVFAETMNGMFLAMGGGGGGRRKSQ